MFITFPVIPHPDFPKITTSSEIQEGKSTSSSRVTVCIDNKCTTRENNSTGSSFLKIESKSTDEKIVTSIESMPATESGEINQKTLWNISTSAKDIFGKIIEFVKKHLTER